MLLIKNESLSHEKILLSIEEKLSQISNFTIRSKRNLLGFLLNNNWNVEQTISALMNLPTRIRNSIF